MKRLALILAALIASAACAPRSNAPTATSEPSVIETLKGATDDGTYLGRIDPLGGQWSIELIGADSLTRFNAWINFSAGGFLNHGAGCSGGYPAFYRLDGARLLLNRLESIRTGKCAAAGAKDRAAAVASEVRLAIFLDQVDGWSRPDNQTLVLSAKDGTRALLKRPIEPHPELAGRWLIIRIGGEPLVTERRAATVTIGMGAIGAHADCNGMGGQFTIPAPGRLSVAGPFMSTAIGCAPEDAAEDALMTQAITQATAYRLEGDWLTFTGGPGIDLRRPSMPNRSLAGEYQACGNTLLGGYHEGPITLAIDERMMRDNAGCTAQYTATGPDLALQLDSGPACSITVPSFKPGEPVGIGGKISTLAVARPDGFGFNEHGQMILRTGRGHLAMCRKGSPLPFGD